MEEKLFIGVGWVRLYLRQARTLKDRRQVANSLQQKLKNMGFSAAQLDSEDPKRVTLGFSTVSHHSSAVEQHMEEASRIFIGDFQITQFEKEIIPYSPEAKWGEEE